VKETRRKGDDDGADKWLRIIAANGVTRRRADRGEALMGKAAPIEGRAAHIRSLFTLVCTSRSSSPLGITRPSKRSCAKLKSSFGDIRAQTRLTSRP
jgi:hypothetical protein